MSGPADAAYFTSSAASANVSSSIFVNAIVFTAAANNCSISGGTINTTSSSFGGSGTANGGTSSERLA